MVSARTEVSEHPADPGAELSARAGGKEAALSLNQSLRDVGSLATGNAFAERGTAVNPLTAREVHVTSWKVARRRKETL